MRQQESREGTFAGLAAKVAVVLTLLAIIAASLVSAGAARADHVQEFDPIIFAVPADEPQPDVNGEIRFLGGPRLFADATGCGLTGERPVQRIQIRDFGGASEKVEVIVLSETEPIEAGTRAVSGSFVGVCLIGSTLYLRYDFIASKVRSSGLDGESGRGMPQVAIPD